MNKVFSIDEIRELLTPVFSDYGVKKAVLFGSYSKNLATAGSDVDLYVDSGLRGLKFVGFVSSVRDALGGKDVDVFDVTHIDSGSLVDREIQKTGVQIYAK